MNEQHQAIDHNVRITRNEEHRVSKIAIAAFILAVWGIVETAILIWAIITQTGFAGGCLFYIWFAFKLRKRDEKYYKKIVTGAKILTVLAFGGLIMLTINTIYFLTASGTIQLSSSPSSHLSLFLLLILYSIGCSVIIFLLSHPDSRKEMSLEETNGVAHTLFVSKEHFRRMMIGALITCALLSGPHLIKNPYTTMIHAVEQDHKILNEIGIPDHMILEGFAERNWTIFTAWTVVGSSGQKIYEISVDSNHHVEIAAYEHNQ